MTQLGRKMLALVSPRWRDPSTCASCGEPFICGATLGGCWCTEVKLNEDARARLRAKFTGCLCRACLERAAQG
jgi:hypothetical protein